MVSVPGSTSVAWFSVMLAVPERPSVNGLLIASVKLSDLPLCVLVSSVEAELKALLRLACASFELGASPGVAQNCSRPSGSTPVGAPKFTAWYRMPSRTWMCWYSAEPTRPHHGSSRSSARLIFHTVGSLKFLSMVSIEPAPPPAGIGWFSGSGLNGALAGSNEVYESSVTPLFWNGLVIHKIGRASCRERG